MQRSRIALLGVLLVGACTTTGYQKDSADKSTPVETRDIEQESKPFIEDSLENAVEDSLENSVEDSVNPLPEQPPLQTHDLEAADKSSPVVSKLLASAEREQATGNWEASANAIERALRIEPRNPVLWHRLAEIHYSQKNWQQSIQLAAKSNTLAKNNTIQRQNWYLMANAYQMIGNKEAAAKYRNRLKKY